MIKRIAEIIKSEIVAPLEKRRDCGHEGETHNFCSKCGADLRVVTSYTCRLCELLGNSSVYPAEKCPDFCSKCGAPKFTFRPIKKKRARKDK